MDSKDTEGQGFLHGIEHAHGSCGKDIRCRTCKDRAQMKRCQDTGRRRTFAIF